MKKKGVLMKMKNFIPVAALLATVVMLAGCPTKPPEVEAPPPAPTPTATTEEPSATVNDTDAAGPSGELLSKRIVYFDFDSSAIRADSRSVVDAHARYLAGNPAQKVRVEGHADERGSREYNIGLGERRGQSVRQALLLQGVAEAQMTTVSYGEERPAVAGSDEQAYAANRRVEIIYIK